MSNVFVRCVRARAVPSAAWSLWPPRVAVCKALAWQYLIWGIMYHILYNNFIFKFYFEI